MDGFYERLVISTKVKSSPRKTIGRTNLLSQPLVHIDDDIHLTNGIAQILFLSLNSKTGTPVLTEDLSYDDPVYKPKKETSNEELL